MVCLGSTAWSQGTTSSAPANADQGAIVRLPRPAQLDGRIFLAANDTFQLQVNGVPGSKPGLVLRGANQIAGGNGNPAGDGLLCVGGQTARSQVQVTSGGSTLFSDFQGGPFGSSSYGLGVPTHYEFWYRDPGNSCSGAGFNFTNAWTVTYLP